LLIVLVKRFALPNDYKRFGLSFVLKTEPGARMLDRQITLRLLQLFLLMKGSFRGSSEGSPLSGRG